MMPRHSYPWLIFGFLKFVLNAVRVLRAKVLDSCARIMTSTLKLSSLHTRVLFTPSETFCLALRLSILASCWLIKKTANNLPMPKFKRSSLF